MKNKPLLVASPGGLVAARYNVARSPKWEEVAHQHLRKQPACLVCGSKSQLNVHHKFPFHFVVTLGRPDLELDERNLYTLCVQHADEHHLLVGHLGNYESYNPELEHWIALTRNLLVAQIKAIPAYTSAVKSRPKFLSQMDQADKDAFLAMLNHVLPPN